MFLRQRFIWKKNYPITPFRHITDYFFIRNEREQFIGVVEDRGQKDLHWYITKDSRKKGYLTRALKETIIPYIFYDVKRDSQIITIRKTINYNNSKKVALNLGFRPLYGQEIMFELKKIDFDWSSERLEEKDLHIDNEKARGVREKMLNLSYELHKISSELAMAYGSEEHFVDDLFKISNKIEFLASEVKEMIFRKNAVE